MISKMKDGWKLNMLIEKKNIKNCEIEPILLHLKMMKEKIMMKKPQKLIERIHTSVRSFYATAKEKRINV